jgi:catechol 2,3-dioxygenase-like lactoylglutathione lyase family enzyme
MSVGDIIVCKISCAQIERSAAFYGLLGFMPARPPSSNDAPWVLQLYGVEGRVRTQMLAREDNPKGVRIELIEWSNQAAQVAGPNAPGAGMLALRSNDMLGDYETLKQAGVEFVSEPMSFPSPAGTTWLVNLRDPDGLSIQLAQFVKKPE